MEEFRTNYEKSKYRREQIATQLSHTGNGYIYGEYLTDCKYRIDDRGWINIKDLSESELRELSKNRFSHLHRCF